jgi:hypothetical protein
MLGSEVIMFSQPTRRAEAGPAYETSLAVSDWQRLVDLPRQVLLAALPPAGDGPADATALTEGLAGMAAIAAGRTWPSRLVRQVAAAIYAADDHPAAAVRADRGAVLAACAAAAPVLAGQVPAGEAAAYRRWVLGIAAAVYGVGRGRWYGLTGTPADPRHLRLLDEIEQALAG